MLAIPLQHDILADLLKREHQQLERQEAMIKLLQSRRGEIMLTHQERIMLKDLVHNTGKSGPDYISLESIADEHGLLYGTLLSFRGRLIGSWSL